MKLLITESQYKRIIEDINSPIQGELDLIISKYDSLGLSSWIYYNENSESIEISSIKIKDKSARRKGLGSSLMGEITSLADKYSLTCVLSPDSSETPLNVLKRFYSGFGFVPNKGRHKDFRFRHSMIRLPKEL